MVPAGFLLWVFPELAVFSLKSSKPLCCVCPLPGNPSLSSLFTLLSILSVLGVLSWKPFPLGSIPQLPNLSKVSLFYFQKTPWLWPLELLQFVIMYFFECLSLGFMFGLPARRLTSLQLGGNGHRCPSLPHLHSRLLCPDWPTEGAFINSRWNRYTNKQMVFLGSSNDKRICLQRGRPGFDP